MRRARTYSVHSGPVGTPGDYAQALYTMDYDLSSRYHRPHKVRIVNVIVEATSIYQALGLPLSYGKRRGDKRGGGRGGRQYYTIRMSRALFIETARRVNRRTVDRNVTKEILRRYADLEAPYDDAGITNVWLAEGSS